MKARTIQTAQCECNADATNNFFTLSRNDSGKVIRGANAEMPVSCRQCGKRWAVTYRFNNSETDGAFIAAAREALPQALGEIAALEQERDEALRLNRQCLMWTCGCGDEFDSLEQFSEHAEMVHFIAGDRA